MAELCEEFTTDLPTHMIVLGSSLKKEETISQVKETPPAPQEALFFVRKRGSLGNRSEITDELIEGKKVRYHTQEENDDCSDMSHCSQSYEEILWKHAGEESTRESRRYYNRGLDISSAGSERSSHKGE